MTQNHDQTAIDSTQLALNLLEQLKEQLPLKIAKLKREAGALASKSVFAAAQAHPVLEPQKVHEAAIARSQALSALGEANGMLKVQSKLFGHYGIYKEGNTLSQCVEALEALVKTMVEDSAPHVDGLMLKAMRYSEKHPDYGTHMATALEAAGEESGYVKVLDIATAMAAALGKDAQAKEGK